MYKDIKELESVKDDDAQRQTAEENRAKINELVREFNNLRSRLESTLEVNGLWDGS